ncbi:hypothetical protein B0H66DRAFT_620616 [Apodospora peruviana]|uniref:Uncharacterized protein n=1 Tax=Apodospora peruviana TaxID=516989 RepID=A0AAE0ID46_9PEZI|nr:hypothetical protein B0H66DRAFT_620616 [Apodospora peruviana]
MVYLDLLYSFKVQLGKTMGFAPDEIESMMQLAVGEAFRTPILMDEMLALAAAHRSTTTNTGNPRLSQDYYLTEATRLQTRAVTQFNAALAAQPEYVSDDTWLAVFLFSTFLGQHALFDIFSSIPSSSPPVYTAESPLSPAPRGRKLHSQKGALFGGYAENRLTSPNHDAIFANEEQQELAGHGPEALVVLAHYAVLEHRARDCWVVGGAGRFLIEAIGRCLGREWEAWLGWPRGVLETEVAFSWDLPLGYLLSLSAFIILSLAPAAVWSGAITPVIVPKNITLEYSVPLIGDVRHMHGNNLLFTPGADKNDWFVGHCTSSLEGGDLPRRAYGAFHHCFNSRRQALLYSASSSSTSTRRAGVGSFGGLTVGHAKLDLSGYSYIWRSYGAGAAVGNMATLGVQEPLSIVFNETRVLTNITCGKNS